MSNRWYFNLGIYSTGTWSKVSRDLQKIKKYQNVFKCRKIYFSNQDYKISGLRIREWGNSPDNEKAAETEEYKPQRNKKEQKQIL